MTLREIVVTGTLILSIACHEPVQASEQFADCPRKVGDVTRWKSAVDVRQNGRDERKLYRGKDNHGGLVFKSFIQTPSKDSVWVTECPIILQEVYDPMDEPGCSAASDQVHRGDLVSIQEEGVDRYVATINDGKEIPLVPESKVPGAVQWLAGYHSGYLYYFFLIERPPSDMPRKGYRIEVFDLEQKDCLDFRPEKKLCGKQELDVDCAERVKFVPNDNKETGTGEGDEPEPND